MPPRKKPVETPLPGQLDMFDNQTDDDLIAENFRLEDLIKSAQAKFDEWAKPHKERIAAIENAIRARLLQRNADSTKTDAGTAYFSNLMNTKIENRETLFDFIADNWETYGNDMLKLGAAIDAVRRYMDENEGKPPPGLSISFFKRLNLKRS
jgi:hypothetical protein